MNLTQGQLTVRGAVIGCIGCTVITAASAYTALKMGALPWPIIFAAIISLFFLKALGNTNLHEANVTHTIMSAGSMVAGGLAFTIPAIWIVTGSNPVDWPAMLAVAIAGVLLGLICMAYLRRHFIEDAALEFPIGQAAAEPLKAGNAGGRIGAKLFGAMGLAGVYTFLRDGLGLLPAIFTGGITLPGISFGLYNSPMMLAMGIMVGTASVAVWFAGAVFANFGIVLGGTAAGLWDTACAQGITQSLGMGVMMGCGFGVIFKDVLPKGVRLLRGSRNRQHAAAQANAMTGGGNNAHAGSGTQDGRPRRRVGAGVLALLGSIAALALCMLAGVGPVPSVVVVAFSWVTCAMAAQSVGQTGIDPMEIFGLIVLLAIAAFSDTPLVQLFFVAAVIAIACGLAGDVMNDFKAGHILGTDPKAQWLGQAIGGVLGAVVASAVMMVIAAAYGPEAFGADGTFIATQASVVATMVTGIPNVAAFAIGLAAGVALYFAKAPVMMLGLGIYLPFYMSATAALGMVAKLVYDAVGRRRRGALDEEQAAHAARRHDESGTVMASGLLGGESIVGVLVALASVAAGIAL